MQARRRVERSRRGRIAGVRAHEALALEPFAELDELVRLQERVILHAVAQWLDAPRVEAVPVDVEVAGRAGIHGGGSGILWGRSFGCAAPAVTSGRLTRVCDTSYGVAYSTLQVDIGQVRASIASTGASGASRPIGEVPTAPLDGRARGRRSISASAQPSIVR